MTKYEWFRWLTFPIVPVILNTVRKDLKALVKKSSKKDFLLLDVGGRKSPYTINIPANVTLLDIPQESTTQEQLHLGFTDEILKTIQKKRSNISDVLIQDMTKSTIPDASYDAVVCVEVIEHVEEDELFVKNISKVITDNGWAYFTTPNGDYIKNEGESFNPDHKRHYTKAQLQKLLEKYFKEVEVIYAVSTGRFRVWGLKSYTLNKPIRLIKTILGNIINRIESRNVNECQVKTAHLIAIAYK